MPDYMMDHHLDVQFSSPSAHPLIAWWYTLAASPEPPPTAPLAERELARRGRVISLIMLLAVAMVLLALIIVPSPQVAIATTVVFLVDMFAVLVFNRRGKIVIAGAIITFMTEGGIIGSTIGDIQLHGGRVDISTLVFLVLVIQGIVVSGSTLPARSVFFFFFINTALMVFLLFVTPQTPELARFLGPTDSYNFRNTLCALLTIYVFATLSTYTWVRSTNESIKRADRAEVVAHYQRELALANQGVKAQNGKLVQGVNEIVQSISSIANDPERELVINRNNLMWEIVVALNNLRARVAESRAESRFESIQLRRTSEAAAALVALLERGQVDGWQPTKTPIDAIASGCLRWQHKQQRAERVSKKEQVREVLQQAIQKLDE